MAAGARRIQLPILGKNMAAATPSGRESKLPKSWEEMTGVSDEQFQHKRGNAPAASASRSTTRAETNARNAAESAPAMKFSGKMHCVNTSIDPRRLRRRSFWREHKNAMLTIAVVLCPTLSISVLALLAQRMHPFDGRYHEGRTISQWVSLLGDEDPMMRGQAFEKLVKLGDEATPQLARALRDPDVERRRDAALAMQKIRPKTKLASEALGGALQDKDLWVRWRSAQALRSMGPHARAAITPLASALTDDDPRVRCAAAQALGRIGKEAASAQDALVSAMKDERTYVRRAAAAAMENILAETNP